MRNGLGLVARSSQLIATTDRSTRATSAGPDLHPRIPHRPPPREAPHRPARRPGPPVGRRPDRLAGHRRLQPLRHPRRDRPLRPPALPDRHLRPTHAAPVLRRPVGRRHRLAGEGPPDVHPAAADRHAGLRDRRSARCSAACCRSRFCSASRAGAGMLPAARRRRRRARWCRPWRSWRRRPWPPGRSAGWSLCGASGRSRRSPWRCWRWCSTSASCRGSGRRPLAPRAGRADWATVQAWLDPFAALQRVLEPSAAQEGLPPAYGFALVMLALSAVLNGVGMWRLRKWNPSGEPMHAARGPRRPEPTRIWRSAPTPTPPPASPGRCGPTRSCGARSARWPTAAGRCWSRSPTSWCWR